MSLHTFLREGRCRPPLGWVFPTTAHRPVNPADRRTYSRIPRRALPARRQRCLEQTATRAPGEGFLRFSRGSPEGKPGTRRLPARRGQPAGRQLGRCSQSAGRTARTAPPRRAESSPAQGSPPRRAGTRLSAGTPLPLAPRRGAAAPRQHGAPAAPPAAYLAPTRAHADRSAAHAVLALQQQPGQRPVAPPAARGPPPAPRPPPRLTAAGPGSAIAPPPLSAPRSAPWHGPAPPRHVRAAAHVTGPLAPPAALPCRQWQRGAGQRGNGHPALTAARCRQPRLSRRGAGSPVYCVAVPDSPVYCGTDSRAPRTPAFSPHSPAGRTPPHR